MIKKKRSQSSCPICWSLDIFGDKWTLLIIRDVLVHKKRHYREFLASPEGIATNILADRLKTLTAEGFLRREDDPDSLLQALYLPTDKALSLRPVIVAIARWGIENGPKTLKIPADAGREQEPAAAARPSRR